MYKKAVTQTSWILITIVLMIIAGTFFAGMMSGIPGLAGRLRGDLGRLLFAPFLTFWDQILSIIGPILNPIMGAVRFSIAMPIAFGAIALVNSFLVGGTARNIIGMLANAPKVGWGFAIKDAWSIGKAGLVSGIKGLLKGAIYGAIVELVISYGLNLLGVPQAIDNAVGGPVPFQTPFGEAQWSWGNAVSGAISGAAGGAVMGSIVPGIGTAIGAAIGGIIGFFMGGLFG